MSPPWLRRLNRRRCGAHNYSKYITRGRAVRGHRRPPVVVRDYRAPHAHVVNIHGQFYVIRFDARGRQGCWLLCYADADRARKVRDQINRRLRRKR